VVSLGSWDNLVSYTIITRDKIDDLAQLRGKKVGIIASAASRRWVLRVMLEDAGSQYFEGRDLAAAWRLAGKIGGAHPAGGIDAAPAISPSSPK